MAGNNKNIVYVGNAKGLLSEANKNLAKIVPDKTIAQIFSDQTIALEKAVQRLNDIQEDEIYKLQKAFE